MAGKRASRRKVPKPSSPSGRGNWLIFADRTGVGEALAALLEAQGESSILISRGESYERTDGEHFRIHPERAEDIRQVFGAALASDQPICRGIIHLWSLDAPLPEEATVASLKTAQTLGAGSVLQLVQEVARVQWRESPASVAGHAGSSGSRGRTLTTGRSSGAALGIGSRHCSGAPCVVGRTDRPRPRQRCRTTPPLISCGGKFPLPMPRIRLRCVKDGDTWAVWCAMHQSAIRRSRPLQWRPDCSYLITGGLGDLGLLVAHWMVEQGARRLILLGRTKLPPRASWNSVEAESRLAHQIAAVRELESLGASVHLASVDVADEGQLSAFLHEFRAEGWPPIRGVVHAAGVLHDGLLTQLDAAALNEVLRPKVIGGWLLHRLLKDAPLDFFVLFSSAGSLLGQPGQGNYAAANAFLDALAHHRRAQGQPALSINWGAWGKLGFADTSGGKRLAARLALLGIRSIAPAQALEVLERLLWQDSTQVMAVPVDWRQFRQFYFAGSEPPLLSELARRASPQSPRRRVIREKRGMRSLPRNRRNATGCCSPT